MPPVLLPERPTSFAPAPPEDATRREFITGVGAAALAAAFLAACGADPLAGDDGADTHEVTDGMGMVTIPTYPQRIVADSVSTFAHLVALGIEPVGVAIPGGIPTSYFRSEDDAVVNVVASDGWTIDIEKALELQPDLIVGVYAEWNVENLQRYKQAVASYAFEEGWRDTEHIYAQFREFAANIGRADEAERAIETYEGKLAAGKEAVAPHVAGLGKVGVVRTAEDGWIGVRTADKGHITSAILAALGITEPEWPAARADEDYLTLSLETLSQLNVADTLFVEANGKLEDLSVLQTDVWKMLDPVKDGRVFYFETTWYNGDLLQLGSIVDEIVTAVTERG
ncbi:MAG: ABC transporter substrate-binding protein [Dehalococcoidia bacterium]|nr:ABC transporter substrate-binding protein [Dehalococcoidia bacterium]